MRDKPWFVVLVGPYASRELAQSAVLEFPADMQKQSPWVRSVASIQADIKARAQRQAVDR
jgi:septal ring-binding cell division protein DamX